MVSKHGICICIDIHKSCCAAYSVMKAPSEIFHKDKHSWPVISVVNLIKIMPHSVKTSAVNGLHKANDLPLASCKLD